MTNKPGNLAEQTCETMVKRIKEEILPLFERAIHDNNLIYENPYLAQCWVKKECLKTECPAISQKGLRCWQIGGTYCGGKIQGVFAQKYQSCQECDVFKDACPTLIEELGEDFNNMMFLINKQKDQTHEALNKVEHLNKELFSSLENLDLKNREIQELMITDKLTGLYNRHHLVTVMEDELSRCARRNYVLSLLLIDIDDFKSFNDKHGHLEGDGMLSFFGAMTRENIRRYDRAFRYGGEEFVILLPETNLTMSFIVAERLRKAFEKKAFMITAPGDSQPKTDSRTLSIGIACYSPGASLQELLAQADEAMYAAKTQGKNRVVTYNKIDLPSQ